ncbi:unnamed protein product [Ostreobium quekettii]|uniref:DUF3160 domain-containing protein n=1 Tax=Ostreobium quekettii TaxID=121088 RepID=A0A8S1JD89_9CHLO|nr:unnamed protein product [Ostreobium quekettii]|eukprot:evm.model.scf_1399.3 EVM.evm.TU.scf_1399.3   scf_1399:17202-21306(-)
MAAPRGDGDPLGFQSALDRQLQSQGDLSIDAFAAKYPPRGSGPPFLDGVSFDPRRAKYWGLIEEGNSRRSVQSSAEQAKRRKRHDGSLLTRLPAGAMEKLTRHGFVVTEAPFASFGDAFHWIYSDDLPVWVGADAMLHAWHRTYDEMLVDVEVDVLAPRLMGVLEGMRGAVPAAGEDLRGTAIEEGIKDADFFLTVAISLLKGKRVELGEGQGRWRGPSMAVGFEREREGEVEDFGGQQASCLGNDDRVQAALAAIKEEELARWGLWGGPDLFDFSQFKPRGHYLRSGALRRYFRTVMWCGRVEVVVGGGEEGTDTDGLAAALGLLYVLRACGGFGDWEAFEDTLAGFVGEADSMGFRQLEAVLGQYCAQVGLKNMAEFKSTRCLDELLVLIKNSDLGTQAICSSVWFSDLNDPVPITLPSVFTFTGQKFVMDSWAISNSVFDRVLFNGKKVPHQHPSCLDVFFSVLGNSSVASEICAKVRDKDLPYHSQLAAIRSIFDQLPQSAWRKNLYTLWLRLLRTLSMPTTGDEFPQAMRTSAWAAKCTETQAGSWTQLRHDTVLYAKQSYGMKIRCEYPAGYVDPRGEFWDAFLDMVGKAKEILVEGAKVAQGGEEQAVERARGLAKSGKGGMLQALDNGDPVNCFSSSPSFRLLRRQVSILERWEEVLGMLSGIAEKERQQRPLAESEVSFLKKIVRIEHLGSGGPCYDGWYCDLFYKSREDSCAKDLIVADVHSMPPDALNPSGFVLHQGVGPPALMTVVVDAGPDLAVYFGPVFRHHEFELLGMTRLTDEEWEERVGRGEVPAAPGWKTYLAAEERGKGSGGRGVLGRIKTWASHSNRW